MLLSNSDIDECTTDMDNCSEKATCADTDGSFLCTCNDGYTGYGVVCHGQLAVLVGGSTISLYNNTQMSMSVRMVVTFAM